MALNDSCHWWKSYFTQKSGDGGLDGLSKIWGGGLEPLSPIASAATDDAVVSCRAHHSLDEWRHINSSELLTWAFNK